MATAQERKLRKVWLSNWENLLDARKMPDREQFLTAFEIELKGSGLGTWIFTEVQRRLDKIVAKLEAAGIPVRILALKARQMGVTTWGGGYQLEKVARHGGQKCVMMAHRDEDTQEIYGSKIQELWEQIPEEMRPHRVRSNRREIIVRHGARERKQRKKVHERGRSYVMVLTAGSETGGRSRTIQHFHASEAAFFKNDYKVLNATFQSVPQKPGTSIILETTANGASGAFHDLWRAAEKGENDFVPVFFPWFSFKEYSRPFAGAAYKIAFFDSMTDQEKATMQLHELSFEQMNWRRWAIPNLCLGDPLLFQAEYPATPDEAFIASGTCRFDHEALLVLESRAPKPIARGTVLNVEGKTKFVSDPAGPVTIYRKVRRRAEYILPADAGEGIRTRDPSAGCVYDRRSRKLVARIHGHIEPQEYADLIWRLGRLYNDALIVPENNGPGLAVIKRLQQRQVERIYQHSVIDSALGVKRDKMGFTTTKQARDFGIQMLASAIANLQVELSVEQIAECRNFQTQDGRKYEAKPGTHDDEVMALVFMFAVNAFEPYDLGPEEDPEPVTVTRIQKFERRLGERLAQSGSDLYDPHLGSEY